MNMNVIRKIKQNAQRLGEMPCHISDGEVMSWAELDDSSDRIAEYIVKNLGDSKTPIPVYGHKSKYSLICFLACVKSGHPYCPIDVSMPEGRVRAIIENVDSPLVMVTEELQKESLQEGRMNTQSDGGFLSSDVICREEIKDIIACENPLRDEGRFADGDDLYYIIYTSGSTGVPKGVQITEGCLRNFVKWSSRLIGLEEGEKHIFVNQAPFSFDLSVADLYMSLCSGGTLVSLTKKNQENMGEMLCAMRSSSADVLVSTPSFAELCLADKGFSAETLPRLATFFFCGETLHNHTASRLQGRFPHAKIYNTYGPTESTVAVTGMEITPQICETVNPLPIGRPKEGTRILIMNEEGETMGDGEKGEIVIVGDTVSVGYLGNRELSEKVFSVYEEDGRRLRMYHTGDEGYTEKGLLYYAGRIDMQIKLHGYRIEIGDIEKNLVKVASVSKAVVVPRVVSGVVKSLTAYVVAERGGLTDFEAGQRIRKELKNFIPDYMVPKKIVFVETMPLTGNGKADRSAFGGKS